jgi:hypothetical protein
MVLPGQEVPAVMAVAVPPEPGEYRVALFATPVETPGGQEQPTEPASYPMVPDAWLHLNVVAETDVPGPASPAAASFSATGLNSLQKALAQAARLQELPDDYLDVTEGFLARWKRRIKRKLLGNFKHAYVDVLSRQQSRFNRQVLVALYELGECCAALEHLQTIGRQNTKANATAKKESEFLAAAIKRSVAAGGAEELAVLLRSLIQAVTEIQWRMNRVEEWVRSRPASELAPLPDNA